MTGRVVSTKMKNTATILVERTATHPLYKKTYKQSKKYLVHAEIELKVGDIVDFIMCRPVSKNKHWKAVKVLGQTFAEIAEGLLKKEAEEVIAGVMPAEKEGNRVEGIGYSEEIKKVEEKRKRVRKEKIVPKP